MSNRKRVTLTFEIDGSDGYNNEAFMRRDFLQELRCCVNDPYEDTFVMKVEDADVPQEMSAREYGRMREQICHQYQDECWDCPFYYDKWCHFDDLDNRTIFQVEKWMKEHSERSEDDGID